MDFKTVCVIALIYFVQTSFGQAIGVGSALSRYGLGNNCLSNLGTSSANGAVIGQRSGGLTAAGSESGIGYGDVNLVGELPVTGQTKVTGSLPVIGFVTFEGHLPAGGMVSLADGCNCQNFY